MTVEVQRHTFTADDYHRMANAGILGEDDRVELIDGEIVNMTPIGNRHMAVVDRLNRLMGRQAGDSAIVRVQGSIRLDPNSEPQPDIAILRWADDFYASRAAGPEDVLLLIEVADTSLAYDRDRKAPLYAGAGIAEYWIVDLKGQSIAAYRDLGARGYKSINVVWRGDSLSPLALPEIVVQVAELFPEAASSL